MSDRDNAQIQRRGFSGANNELGNGVVVLYENQKDDSSNEYYDDSDDDNVNAFDYDDEDDDEDDFNERQYVQTRASASEICANPSHCNRELMYLFFEKIQRKVQLQLSAINDIFMRSMSAKKYPHTAFYKKLIDGDRQQRIKEGNVDMNEKDDNGNAGVSRGRASASNNEKGRTRASLSATSAMSGSAMNLDSRRQSNGVGGDSSDAQTCDFDDSIRDMRSTINERVIDTLNGVSLNDERRTVRTLADIVNQCLRYELAIVNLVTLSRLIVKALANFSNTHVRYDEKIKILQSDYSDGKTSSVKANELRRLQDELDTTRNVLQKLLNQVPLQMAQLKTELELIALYDDTDDTPKIHRFLTDPLIMEIVKRSCRLTKAYSLLRHSWDKLIPSDFF